MKRIAAIIAGAIIGIGLMLLAFPFLSDWIIGHIEGEDQMSANFELLAIGLVLCCFVGVHSAIWPIPKANNPS